ncbi:MAG: hypothetical protein WAW79_02255 [Steroidobacteraceae bacterium]
MTPALRCGLPLTLLLFAGAAAADWPADAELEAQAARIGRVTVNIRPIFDPGKPGERKKLFRLADRWHVDTRESTIEAQLLFRPGDLFSRRVLDETERNMRELRFIREPEIRVSGYHDGLVDLEVLVHDVWTLNPGIAYGRAGGKDSTNILLEELNLLGYGKHLAIDYSNDVDRSSYTLTWRDPNFLGTRWRNAITLQDSDDGSGSAFEFVRPFYSLDTRWSTGLSFGHDDSIQSVYRLGHPIAEYRRDALKGDLRYGWSGGLRGGWTRRSIVGIRQDEARYAEAAGATAPAVLPADRKLVYPYLRFEAIQDDFDTTRNLDLIARTEDLVFGARYALELGWAATAYGSDRDAAILRAEASRGFRLRGGRSLFIAGSLASRIEGGSLQDALLSGGLRFYRQTSPRGTFFASLTGQAGHNLDADNELVLGGEEGLRGYPLRYQTGDGRALLTLEQRIYTQRTIWKIADVGAAVFFDMGRTWGDSIFGPTEPRGTLKDIGFGLRLGNSRSALGNVMHIDVAFPLDGDRTIDDVQLLVNTKRTF